MLHVSSRFDELKMVVPTRKRCGVAHDFKVLEPSENNAPVQMEDPQMRKNMSIFIWLKKSTK